MECIEFKRRYEGSERMTTEAFMFCFEHARECEDCSNHMLKVDLENKGVDLTAYPCVHMAKYANFRCEHHPDLLDCDDALIVYDPESKEYALHGPRPACTPIGYCPWCGVKLPSG